MIFCVLTLFQGLCKSDDACVLGNIKLLKSNGNLFLARARLQNLAPSSSFYADFGFSYAPGQGILYIACQPSPRLIDSLPGMSSAGCKCGLAAVVQLAAHHVPRVLCQQEYQRLHVLVPCWGCTSISIQAQASFPSEE